MNNIVFEPQFDIKGLEEYAKDTHRKYGNCAQAVTKALMDYFGIHDEMLYKSMSGIGGGLATMGGPCGALNAAIVMIGARYGRGLSDLEKKDGGKSILLARNDFIGKFYKWFELKFGNVNCLALRKSWIGVDLDMRIPWQSEMAEALGLHEKGCFELVGMTTKMAAEIILDEDAINNIVSKVANTEVIKSDCAG
jgi:C_GCAxxG_C_C family probable redox protein